MTSEAPRNRRAAYVSPEILAQAPFFQALEAIELLEVAPMVHEQSYDSGQTVVLQGEPCQAVFIVARGVLRTWRVSADGREQVLGYLGPGAIFGIVTALDGDVNPAGVDAVTPTTLLAISCQDFGHILHEHPTIAIGAAEYLAREVRRLSQMVEDLALHTVRARVARFLLTRVNDPSGPRRWTQEAIANYIGTVREMVARTFRDLAAEGLIRRERGRVVILDREALKREAGMQS